MTHRVQNLPRAIGASRRVQTPLADPSSWKDTLKCHSGAAAAVVLVGLAVAVCVLLGLTTDGAGEQARIDGAVTELLAGIPQHDRALGYPNAPVTLEVFADLKDPDSRKWWNDYLPAIVRQDVRTGLLQLHFRSYKTNTRSPVEFVHDQAAALAAGAQDKLWSYVGIFYRQRRNAPTESEFEPYATNSFLQGVARQVPGLDSARWRADRHTGHREEQPSEESDTADALQLHVTPSFRIGRTGGRLTNYSGSTVLKYKRQRPLSYIKASDLKKTIDGLDPRGRGTD
jgi:hypothetical protein